MSAPGATRKFRDGDFTFYAAEYPGGRVLVFRVRADRSPHARAGEKGIVGYTWLRSAATEEIAAWLKDHPDYPET